MRLSGEHHPIAKCLSFGLIEAVESRVVGAADRGRLLQRDFFGRSGVGQPLARRSPQLLIAVKYSEIIGPRSQGPQGNSDLSTVASV